MISPGDVISNTRIIRAHDRVPGELHRKYTAICQGCGSRVVTTAQALKGKRCVVCSRATRYSVGRIFKNHKIIQQSDKNFKVKCCSCGVEKSVETDWFGTDNGCRACQQVFPDASLIKIGKYLGFSKERVRQLINEHPEFTSEYLLSVDPVLFRFQYCRKKTGIPRCILDGTRVKDEALRKKCVSLYLTFRRKYAGKRKER